MTTKLLRFTIVNNITGYFIGGGLIGKIVRSNYHQNFKQISTVSNLNFCLFRFLRNFPNGIKCIRVPVRLKSNESLCVSENDQPVVAGNDIPRKIPKVQKLEEINYLLNELKKKENYCNSDWERINDLVLSAGKVISVNEKNLETVVMKYIVQCDNLNFARSYLSYLKSNNKIVHPVTASAYLKLMYRCWSSHIPDDVSTVEMFCDEILKLPLLEYKVTEALIFGLCLTKRWKESLKVAEKVKEFYDISPLSQCAIIKAAFKNDEFDLGLKYLEEMMVTDKKPHQSVYETWLEASKDKSLALTNLLNFLSKHNEELYVDCAKNILKQIQNLQIKSHEKKLLASLTEVNNKGACRHCKNILKQAVLTAEEFEKLRSSVMSSVILGKDVFRKTRPEELLNFQEFLKKTAPYDFVLDGLNIAYSAGSKYHTTDVFANILRTVVKYFVQKKKKVLILGRRHMKSWPKEIMADINRNANVFLMEDLSEDDPYLLYSALYSGISTNFVSRDLMRGHKYLLKLEDEELNTIFWKWQCTHQYILVYALNNGDVILKEPVKHLQSVQYIVDKEGNKRWHVPCKPKDDAYVPGHKKLNFKMWLCLPEL